MICIDAENLQEGLYNIKDGKIYKYKAKGGTVRAYELRDIVTCGECKHSRGVLEYCAIDHWVGDDDDFCSYGCREEE